MDLLKQQIAMEVIGKTWYLNGFHVNITSHPKGAFVRLSGDGIYFEMVLPKDPAYYLPRRKGGAWTMVDGAGHGLWFGKSGHFSII